MLPISSSFSYNSGIFDLPCWNNISLLSLHRVPSYLHIKTTKTKLQFGCPAGIRMYSAVCSTGVSLRLVYPGGIGPELACLTVKRWNRNCYAALNSKVMSGHS